MMMPPRRRRATDANVWYRVWISLPLVDRRTGEWSLTRSLAVYFALRTGVLLTAVSDDLDQLGWAAASLITANVLATMACAFGKTVFEAVALRIAGRAPADSTAPTA